MKERGYGVTSLGIFTWYPALHDCTLNLCMFTLQVFEETMMTQHNKVRRMPDDGSVISVLFFSLFLLPHAASLACSFAFKLVAF